jgi:hypothetical protein
MNPVKKNFIERIYILLFLILTGNNNKSSFYSISNSLAVDLHNQKKQIHDYLSLIHKSINSGIKNLIEVNVFDCKEPNVSNIKSLFDNGDWLSLENCYFNEDYQNINHEKKIQYLFADLSNGKSVMILLVHPVNEIILSSNEVYYRLCSKYWKFIFRNKEWIIKKDKPSSS